ncbi:polyprenyl synthetase [Streptomyces sparsus]
MTEADGDTAEGRTSDAALLLAGAADLALSTATAALRGARSLLNRSDLADLAQDAQQEVKARGRLLLQRHAVPEPHMELLARQITARRGPQQ